MKKNINKLIIYLSIFFLWIYYTKQHYIIMFSIFLDVEIKLKIFNLLVILNIILKIFIGLALIVLMQKKTRIKLVNIIFYYKIKYYIKCIQYLINNYKTHKIRTSLTVRLELKSLLIIFPYIQIEGQFQYYNYNIGLKLIYLLIIFINILIIALVMIIYFIPIFEMYFKIFKLFYILDDQYFNILYKVDIIKKFKMLKDKFFNKSNENTQSRVPDNENDDQDESKKTWKEKIKKYWKLITILTLTSLFLIFLVWYFKNNSINDSSSSSSSSESIDLPPTNLNNKKTILNSDDKFPILSTFSPVIVDSSTSASSYEYQATSADDSSSDASVNDLCETEMKKTDFSYDEKENILKEKKIDEKLLLHLRNLMKKDT